MITPAKHCAANFLEKGKGKTINNCIASLQTKNWSVRRTTRDRHNNPGSRDPCEPQSDWLTDWLTDWLSNEAQLCLCEETTSQSCPKLRCIMVGVDAEINNPLCHVIAHVGCAVLCCLVWNINVSLTECDRMLWHVVIWHVMMWYNAVCCDVSGYKSAVFSKDESNCNPLEGYLKKKNSHGE